MSLEKSSDQRLNELLAEYQTACPDVDGAASFMPGMWRQIEARRNPAIQWAAMTRRVLAGAFALCLLFGVVMHTGLNPNSFYLSTYIETLDADAEPEDLAELRPASFVQDLER
jgi:hypothetical protein